MGRFVVVVGLLTGCLVDHTIVCDDRRCPAGTVCVEGGCASPDQIAACAGLPDDASCTAGALMGACQAGWCQEVLCGDGKRIGTEVCDDGNQRSGDGCSADCVSKETCGNEYVDTLVGEECDSGVYGLAGDGCSSVCTLEIASWSDISPHAIPARYRASAAYDSIRHRIVVFGGFDDGISPTNDTWEWDGTNWRERSSPAVPPVRAAHGMVFDEARGETLMFGGVGTDRLGDTWLWNGNGWREAHPAHVPAPRTDPGLAYDPVHQQVVMYGGATTGGNLLETWTWDGADWTQHEVPGPIATSELAWDEASQRVIANGTWEWDGSAWTQVSTMKPSGTIVEGPDGHPVTYSLSQMWQWANGSWTQLAAPTITPSRSTSAFAFDRARNRLVVVGGIVSFGSPLLGDTWEWDGTSWTKALDTPQPLDVNASAAAYVPWTGHTLLFGGATALASTANNETWEWDGQAWIPLSPADKPSPRTYHAMVATNHDVLLFGGSLSTTTDSDELWSWDGTTWSLLSTGAGPAARRDHAMTYSPDRDRTILFGGTARGPNFSTIVYNDTWEWDGTQWTELHPAHTPATRVGAVLTYDVGRKRAILVGGSDTAGSQYLNDTWEWDGVDWTARQATMSPPPSSGGSGAYVPTRHSIIYFGGRTGTAYPNEVWEWNGSDWARLSTVTSTHIRVNYTMVYDAAHAQILAVGGAYGATNALDVSALTFSSAAQPRDVCSDLDSDGDGLVGCADPDCWGRCSPTCPPGTTCDPASPHCGDGACSVVEDRWLCPDDCN